MAKSIIEVKNLHKAFRVYSDKQLTLKERLIHIGESKYTTHPVLKGVDLAVERGMTIALIGENGSGKSTLLKLLSGIIYPDKGSIKMSGKVSSLLELGAGFHPDFTGRENIYNNASIFGLTRKQIDERYDQIVAFSELEEFIDNPIRTYSSGMYMRLAFSVAINVDADILLIDEILAVGDAHFQKKCMNMIRQLKKKGVTIILVTHDMGAVERISDYTVWLEEGLIRESGLSRKVIDSYLLYQDRKNSRTEQQVNPAVPPGAAAIRGDGRSHAALQNEIAEDDRLNANRWGNRSIEITDVKLIDKQKKPVSMINSGDRIEILISYEVKKPVDSIVFGIGINNLDGISCIATNSDIRQIKFKNIGHKGEVKIVIDSLQLVEGTYILDVACHADDGLPYDFHKNYRQFTIHSQTKDSGIYNPKQEWTIKCEEI